MVHLLVMILMSKAKDPAVWLHVSPWELDVLTVMIPWSA